MVKNASIKKPKIHKDMSAPSPQHNGQNQEEFLIHVGQILKAKSQLEGVKKILKAARRAAQDSGYILADMDEAISMREMEPETVKETIRRKATYATWMGLAPGIQADLFEEAEQTDEDKWAKEGYEDGLVGVTADGERYDTATTAGQIRLKNWNKGQDILKDKLVQMSNAAKKKAKADKKAKPAKEAVDAEAVH